MTNCWGDGVDDWVSRDLGLGMRKGFGEATGIIICGVAGGVAGFMTEGVAEGAAEVAAEGVAGDVKASIVRCLV